MADNQSFEDLVSQTVDLNVNGEVGVGIASAGEKRKINKECLFVGDDDKMFISHLLALLDDHPSASENMKNLVIAAAVIIRRKKWYDDDSYTTHTTEDSASDEQMSAATDALKQMGNAPFSNAVTILTYTKVNWYLTNHHVGTGTINPLVRKVCDALEIRFGSNVNNDANYKLLWIMGHWLSTVRTLISIGFLRIEGKTGFDDFPKPTDDIIIRRGSYPSGTAKLGVVMAGLEKLACSIHRHMMSPNFEITLIRDNSRAVLSQPHLYHVGAAHLCGVSRVMKVEESIILWTSAFIHGAFPDSTLAKSKALLKRAEVVNDPTFIQASLIRKTIIAGQLSEEAITAKVSEVLGDIQQLSTESHNLILDFSRSRHTIPLDGSVPHGNRAAAETTAETVSNDNELTHGQSAATE